MLIGAALLTGHTQAHGQNRRGYAAISLIGDELVVHERRGETGASIGGIKETRIDARGAGFDRIALLGVDDIIRQHESVVQTALLGASAELYKRENQSLKIEDETFDYLAQAASVSQRPYLIALLKNRCPARFMVAGRTVGEGQVEGLGFYLDDSAIFPNETDTSLSRGALISFACFSEVLLDADTKQILSKRPIFEWSSKINEAGMTSAWNLLSPKQKEGELKELVRKGVQDATPSLISH